MEELALIAGNQPERIVIVIFALLLSLLSLPEATGAASLASVGQSGAEDGESMMASMPVSLLDILSLGDWLLVLLAQDDALGTVELWYNPQESQLPSAATCQRYVAFDGRAPANAGRSCEPG